MEKIRVMLKDSDSSERSKEINARALAVFENRRRELKKIEERKKQEEEKERAALENFINLILNVFEASNRDAEEKMEQENLLVWGIQLTMREDNKIECLVTFDLSRYYGKNFDDMKEKKNLISAMKVLESAEITERIFNQVYDYFIKIAQYEGRQTGNKITIIMKKPTN